MLSNEWVRVQNNAASGRILQNLCLGSRCEFGTKSALTFSDILTYMHTKTVM